jgi:hypothetical protein
MLTQTEKRQREANKALLIESMQSAESSENKKAVLFGKVLDFVVANFLRKGFVIAGTDIKFSSMSDRQVVLANAGNIMVVVSEAHAIGDITRINITNY